MMRPLLILMLAAAAGFAQPAHKNPPAAPAGRWPIESLAIEGNRIYSSAQIAAIAGLKIGQLAGKPEFEAARQRLVASGAFETVGYKFTPGSTGKGYAAVFQVNEIEQCYRVEFEELHVSEKDLRADLAAKDPLFSTGRLPATQPVFERYVKWIEVFLAAHNAADKIVGSVQPARGNEFAIVFRPARNPPPVALITFRGNSVISQSVLHEAIMGAATGTPYTEDRFRDILNSSIRPLYEARGRVRVAFPELHTEPAANVTGLRVTVTVDEGESYSLGSLSIDGESPIAPDELLRTAQLKPGDVANFDRVNQGLEEIRLAERKSGYLDAKVTAERHIDDGKKTVDLVVHIDAGPRYTMGKLAVMGLEIEGETEILRMWTMKPGKPFNPEYPDFFLKTVREEGAFDHLGKTSADVKLNPTNLTADVTLHFAGDGATQKKPTRRR